MSRLHHNAYYDNSKHCTLCGVKSEHDLQFWHLTNYYGLSGYFCPTCYMGISHRNGEPKNPDFYAYAIGVLVL